MKGSFYLTILALILIQGCVKPGKEPPVNTNTLESYLDFSERDDQFTGGIKMIPVSTPKGEFRVWTKRVGIIPI